MTAHGAVFLDRDGTIIEDTGFVRDPADVRPLPGALNALRRLKLAGWPVVIVTNQSGIARGLMTDADYRAVDRDPAVEDELFRRAARRHACGRENLLQPLPPLRRRGDVGRRHRLQTAGSPRR